MAISIEKRKQIIGLHLAKLSSWKISSELSISQSTISRIIRLFEETGRTKTKSRTGRPKLTSVREDRRIERECRLDPSSS